MRVLIMCTPVPTHFMALVPLAWALRGAGHEVLIAGQPDVMGAVKSAGLNGVSVGVGFHIDERQAGRLEPNRRLVESNSREALEEQLGAGYVFGMHAWYMWRNYLDTAREFRADVVVSDPLEFTALMVGGVLGVPVLHHRWGVDPISRRSHEEASGVLAGQCARLGLDGLPEPAAMLDPCPPSLQLPDAVPGTHFRFVPYNGNGLLPEWAARERKEQVRRRTRRVVVSLGQSTLEMNGVPFVRDFLREFGKMADVEVIATAGEKHRQEIGPVPDGVRLVDPMPLHLLLEDCDAVVHHGGAGTALTATAFGLPQLVLPQMADQFAFGDRLAASGAAVSVDTAEGQNDPPRLRAALAELLTTEAYPKAAGELRREMESLPTLPEIVTDLENGRFACAAAAR